MPVHRGKDSKGPFYQWGGEGKKYHYKSGDDVQPRRRQEEGRETGPGRQGQRLRGLNSPDLLGQCGRCTGMTSAAANPPEIR